MKAVVESNAPGGADGGTRARTTKPGVSPGAGHALPPDELRASEACRSALAIAPRKGALGRA